MKVTSSKILGLSFTVLLCSAALQLFAQNIDYDAIELTTIQVTDNIHMLQMTRGGNLAVSSGEDGTFVIDAHFMQTSEKVTAAIAEITDRPVDFIVNSHFHFDHTGGNENFGHEGAIILAQDNSRKRMEEDQYVSAADIIQEAYEGVALPKITFFESMRFYYNGHTIDLMYNGPGHTDGDAQIFFREANVMHTGDLFVRYGLPFIDHGNGGSMDGMIDGLWEIAGLIDDQTKVIPGHGALATRSDLLEFRGMLVDIRDRLKQEMAQGKSADEVVASNYAVEGYAVSNANTERWLRAEYKEYR